jgi:hypothetical protein
MSFLQAEEHERRCFRHSVLTMLESVNRLSEVRPSRSTMRSEAFRPKWSSASIELFFHVAN